MQTLVQRMRHLRNWLSFTDKQNKGISDQVYKVGNNKPEPIEHLPFRRNEGAFPEVAFIHVGGQHGFSRLTGWGCLLLEPLAWLN